MPNENIIPEETNLDVDSEGFENKKAKKPEEDPFDSLSKRDFSQPKEKESEKKPDGKPEEKKPDAVIKPDTTGDKIGKVEPEFYEIPYMKDKDGTQLKAKIPFAERDTYLQKGYNYDKVKQTAETANASLQTANSTLLRVARVEGFNTVDEYLAELGNREKVKLAEKIEEAAGDPDAINEIIKNHPIVLATQEKDRSLSERERKLDFASKKDELRNQKFFKELEPELDQVLERSPGVEPMTVYKFLLGEYTMSGKLDELIKTTKQTTEKKVIADIHDKERRSAPTGGNTDEGADVIQPSGFTKKIADIFGVSALEVAKMSHEKMKRR